MPSYLLSLASTFIFNNNNDNYNNNNSYRFIHRLLTRYYSSSFRNAHNTISTLVNIQINHFLPSNQAPRLPTSNLFVYTDLTLSVNLAMLDL